MSKAIKVTNTQHRLNELLDILSISKSELSRRTGVKPSTLSNYLHGNREPDSDSLIQLSDPFHINPAWLMGYEVDMYLGKEYDKAVSTIDSVYSQLNEDTKELLITFEKFNQIGKNEILRYMEYLKSKGEYNED